MSIGTITQLTSAADIEALPDEQLRVTARAALAAGYKIDLRDINCTLMIFANGKHFHPLTNWEQCVRLIVDTDSNFELTPFGMAVLTPDATGGLNREARYATTDAEYRKQMCEAVVINCAKGCPL